MFLADVKDPKLIKGLLHSFHKDTKAGGDKKGDKGGDKSAGNEY